MREGKIYRKSERVIEKWEEKIPIHNIIMFYLQHTGYT